MIVEKNQAIEMDDGLLLRANIFRPVAEGSYPVIMSMGLYGKDVHFADAYPQAWGVLKQKYPGIDADGSTGRYLRWEVPDPERWVSAGFVVISIDSRGSGSSPGFLDPFSQRETRDYYEAIEWAAAQPWSNGAVGLLGVSYLAIKQWQVAGIRPPHLKAIAPWEGATDSYRDWSYHGGIISNGFNEAWWPRQVLVNQYGSGSTSHRDRDTGERTTGPADFSEPMLEGNRLDLPSIQTTHPLDDAWHQERSAVLERIEVPVLSAGNWGGAGLHLRGNVEGFLRAGSSQKWLSLHDGTHFESFYLPEYVDMQMRFFGHFLRGDDNGWEREPAVRYLLRRPDQPSSVHRSDHWPLDGTNWRRLHLDGSEGSLTEAEPTTLAECVFQKGEAVAVFSTGPTTEPYAIAGPVTLRLEVASSTSDADIFATMHLIRQDGTEVVFEGAHEPSPLTRGWLRASHRALDEARSLPWRPWHSHSSPSDLIPGEPVAVDVELWPTSCLIPVGYKLQLRVQAEDYIVDDVAPRMPHDHAKLRNPLVYGGRNVIRSGPGCQSYLTIPVVPIT